MHKGYNGVLNRRQELPDEAFIEPEELKRIERGAKRGKEPKFLFFINFLMNALTGQGGELMTLFRTLMRSAAVFGLFRGIFGKRNPDELLPVIAISYVRRPRPQPPPGPPLC